MKLNRTGAWGASALLTFALTAAGCTSDEGEGGDTPGDGDGDIVGDGDGDGTGGTAPGDGDGDGTGGTAPGDGDGDAPGGMGGMGGLPATGGVAGDGDGDIEEPAPIEAVFAGKLDVADGLYAVSFTSDGLIYVAGERLVDTDEGEPEVLDMHIVVARYTAAGAIDTNFGDEGVVLINTISVEDDDEGDSAPGDEGTSAIAALPDGGVAVGIGANDGALGNKVLLVRLDADGDFFEDFGTEGVKELSISGWTTEGWTTAGGTDGPSEQVYDIRLDTSADEDRLVVFGAAPAPAGGERLDNDRYVARILLEDGSLDESFSTDGLFSIDFGELAGSDGARRGSVLPDGSTYSFGYTNYGLEAGRHHIQILHLDADGVPVEDFGFQANAETCGTAQEGVICSNPNLAGGGFAEAYGAAVQSDGKIVTTGYGRADSTTLPPDLVSFRFGATSMDANYAVAGGLIIDSGDEDRGRDVVALADDRMVHGGKYSGVPAIFVTTKGGELWDGFGDGGIRVYPTSDGNFRALATQDGVIAAVADGGTELSPYLVILKVAE